MKRITGISALFTAFLLLLTGSGFTLHFHYCGKDNVTIARIHSTGADSEILCTCADTPSHCCSSNEDENTSKNLPGCCVDFEKDLKTDKDYNPITFRFGFSPVETELLVAVGHTSAINSSEVKFFNYTVPFYPPPEGQSISVLLL